MILKRKSMYGLEIELITLDSEGKLASGAPGILEAVKGKPIESIVRKEISKSLIELGAKEKRSVEECAAAFIENIEETVEIAEKLGYHLLPLGTHPGRKLPELHSTEWYDAKKAVLGEDTFKEGRICGFHFHYMLPEGIIEKTTERITQVKRSAAKDIFLQQYNFLAACDPAMITFCQSTPFWMGRNWAKDCRVLTYRDLKVQSGGDILRGIHYYLPMFGTLASYEFTLDDIRVLADSRKMEWLRLLEQRGFPTNEIACYPTLKFVWGPLRVNKIGTFEYRGPDMTHPEIIFSTSSLLVFLLKTIEEQQISVEPSDLGISEPFLFEDGIVYVPSHAELRNLERQSVINGLDSSAVYNYCSRLIELADRLGKPPRRLKRIRDMVESRKTISDEMIDMVRKNGYDLKDVPEDMMNHLALYHANKMSAGLKDLKKQFKR
ncbi:hypothetical protein JXA56_04710 [Candidatus Micrarchaeota archaeon]|nr:hypothetical protein [Candidatus Micrarchaeota archaeon]